MNMNGKNGLACTKSHSELDGDIDIYPLPHLKVLKEIEFMDIFSLVDGRQFGHSNLRTFKECAIYSAQLRALFNLIENQIYIKEAKPISV